MITVAEAEKIILAETREYGSELVDFRNAAGRILAEDIVADRDLPPCNRVTMDGIAIRYAAFETGIRSFSVKATQAAGDATIEIQNDECIEIMTGAALPDSADTVIRYEDVTIENGIAAVTIDTVKQGQNIHYKGRDKKKGDVVLRSGTRIDASVISMAASVGKYIIPAKHLPLVGIISTGSELVDAGSEPEAHQIRSSNSYTISAVLEQYGINADLMHLPDDKETTEQQLSQCLEKYDVLILSGGVSMGKYDYVPEVLEDLKVEKLFHKVKQRPGKPFWFGRHASGVLVFAFPGNPVSAFMCLHRYLVPWLEMNLKAKSSMQKAYAVLDRDVTFTAPLQYFMQVELRLNEQGQLTAIPVEGNGSGDFANLVDSDAFMELPLEQTNFKKGEAYRVWPFKNII